MECLLCAKHSALHFTLILPLWSQFSQGPTASEWWTQDSKCDPSKKKKKKTKCDPKASALYLLSTLNGWRQVG